MRYWKLSLSLLILMLLITSSSSSGSVNTCPVEPSNQLGWCVGLLGWGSGELLKEQLMHYCCSMMKRWSPEVTAQCFCDFFDGLPRADIGYYVPLAFKLLQNCTKTLPLHPHCSTA